MRTRRLLPGLFLALAMAAVVGCSSGQQAVTSEPKPTDKAAPAPPAPPVPPTGTTGPTQTAITPPPPPPQPGGPGATKTNPEPPVVPPAGGTRGSPTETQWARPDGALKRVHFEYDKSSITPEAAEILKKDRDYLMQNAAVKILIEGHCDERGTVEYNLALGERRANSVKRFLEDLRIDAKRMDIISYGEERPFDAASNEEAWAKNRRAEFVELSK